MADERLARALRSRIRRQILTDLTTTEMLSVHGFANRYGISESCASKHFGLLNDLGFLQAIERPPEKFYKLIIPEIEVMLKSYERVVKALERKHG